MVVRGKPVHSFVTLVTPVLCLPVLLLLASWLLHPDLSAVKRVEQMQTNVSWQSGETQINRGKEFDTTLTYLRHSYFPHQ